MSRELLETSVASNTLMGPHLAWYIRSAVAGGKRHRPNPRILMVDSKVLYPLWVLVPLCVIHLVVVSPGLNTPRLR